MTTVKIISRRGSPALSLRASRNSRWKTNLLEFQVLISLMMAFKTCFLVRECLLVITLAWSCWFETKLRVFCRTLIPHVLFQSRGLFKLWSRKILHFICKDDWINFHCWPLFGTFSLQPKFAANFSKHSSSASKTNGKLKQGGNFWRTAEWMEFWIILINYCNYGAHTQIVNFIPAFRFIQLASIIPSEGLFSECGKLKNIYFQTPSQWNCDIFGGRCTFCAVITDISQKSLMLV